MKRPIIELISLILTMYFAMLVILIYWLSKIRYVYYFCFFHLHKYTIIKKAPLTLRKPWYEDVLSLFVIGRNRTSSRDIGYGLYLYFLGLSTRNVAKALSFLNIVKRSHVAIWNWIQKYQPKRISSQRNKIDEFVVDGTQIKVGY